MSPMPTRDAARDGPMTRAAIAEMKRKVPESVGACFDLIEKGLSGPWAMGDSFTVSDPYLFTLSGWMEGDGLDLVALPRR